MFKTTIKIDGMMCSMCEAHVNDAIRAKLRVKKVTSSHKKGETVIISEGELTMQELCKVLDETGYKVISAVCEPCGKKGLFGWK